VHDTVVDVAPTPAIPDAPTVAPSAPTPAPTDIGEGGGTGGASRVLAYDGALKLRYPPSSIRAREEGAVLLNVLVDAEGHAQRVEIARGSGTPRSMRPHARPCCAHASSRCCAMASRSRHGAWYRSGSGSMKRESRCASPRLSRAAMRYRARHRHDGRIEWIGTGFGTRSPRRW
jgi:hypothetical protein